MQFVIIIAITKARRFAHPVVNVIKKFGGNLDVPKIKKLKKVWLDD